jgi:16S rRNA (guanine527-N7)-methyltransferase
MKSESQVVSSLTSLEVRKILELNEIPVNESQWKLLEDWGFLLKKTNEQINLVSRKDIDFLWENHILHCIALLKYRKIPINASVCDFGTGGGLPGIVIAILFPEIPITLIDSKQKKTKAVTNMVSELNLSNVEVVCGRGEELAQNRYYRNRYSVILSRAVSSIENLILWTQNLRTSPGVLHLYKGGDLTKELQNTSIIKPLLKVETTLIELQGYERFSQDEKQIVSLHFR